jgi:hypothetical protein
MMVIICVFAVSFFGLWGLQLFERLYNKWAKADCAGIQMISIDNAFKDWTDKDSENIGLINCYCEQQFKLYGNKALNILFEDGEKYCQEWYTVYVSQNFINIILALWIALVNWGIQEIFNYMGKLRNTKNITDNYIYRTLTICIFQYINNAIMFLFAYHTFSEEIDNEKLFQGQFQDFNQRWYLVIGVPIITAIFF